jgi:hypothetical protein
MLTHQMRRCKVLSEKPGTGLKQSRRQGIMVGQGRGQEEVSAGNSVLLENRQSDRIWMKQLLAPSHESVRCSAKKQSK